MAESCDDKGCALDELRIRQSGTLKTILIINVAGSVWTV
jgi:hypothetical protein